METLEVLMCCLFLCMAACEFRCPGKIGITGCTCIHERWWNNEVRTIVNCSTANLEKIPNLSVLEKYEITHLILSNNNISEIYLRDFTDIIIKKIDISYNPIGNLDTDSASPLPRQLTTLVMKKSKISLSKGLYLLRGLDNLTELILDSNTIENESQILPDNIFKGLNLKSLKQLSLQSCEIGDISASAFIGLENLEELDLSYNYLEEIPEAIQKLPNLRKLFLHGNNIMQLQNNSFLGLRNLQDLNLNVNEISQIEIDAFKGLENSLKDLRLHYNNLNTIPSDALRKLRLLSFLMLSRNNIQFIPKNAFVGFSNLKMLELDSNDLIFYDEMFTGLENTLETLTLRETGLRLLPVKSFLPLNRLTDLDVSHNHIHSLSRGNIGYLKLKTIDLSHNAIGEIHSDVFAGITRTIDIDLDSNKIRNISFVLKVTPCAFNYIDVSENDIICDCDTEKIINSGIVLGVGPTGNCRIIDDSSEQEYKLGTSALSEALIEHCNKTERVFDCQNMELTPNVALINVSSISVLWLSIIICRWLNIFIIL